MNRILILLDQIIDAQRKIDESDNIKALKEHQSLKILGNSWMATYLSNLRELIQQEQERILTTTVSANHKDEF